MARVVLISCHSLETSSSDMSLFPDSHGLSSALGLVEPYTLDPMLLQPTTDLTAMSHNTEVFHAQISPTGGHSRDAQGSRASASHPLSDDSDCSTDDDDETSYFKSLGRQMGLLREINNRVYENDHLVTPAWSARRRHIIHAMARLYGLSHATIGRGTERNILVSSVSIRPMRDAHLIKCRGATTSKNPMIDLYVVQVTIPKTEGPRVPHTPLWWTSGKPPSFDCVNQTLEAMGLPTPKNVTLHITRHGLSPCSVYILEYGLLESAAGVVCNKLRLWSSHRWLVGYRYPGSDRSDMLEGSKQRLTAILDGLPPDNPLGLLKRDNEPTPRQRASPRYGNRGYSSEGSDQSAQSMATDYSSSASMTKKRKRQPRIEAGYACAAIGCGRVFDTASEKTKHERIHQWGSDVRPHQCSQCDKRFFHPKDVRRHERSMHDKQ